MPLLSVANQSQLKMLFNVYQDMLQLRQAAAVKFTLWESGYGTGDANGDPNGPLADPETFGIMDHGCTFYNFAPDRKTPLGPKKMVPWATFLETHFDTEVRYAMGCGRLREKSILGGYYKPQATAMTAPDRP